MRWVVVAVLVVSCGVGLADELPKDTNEIKSLTVEQAADLVMVVASVKNGEGLYLDGLTSINKDVAQELAKFDGRSLSLDGLTSIDKDVAQELAKLEVHRLSLDGLTSIDKDVAQELAKFEGRTRSLDGVPSRNKGMIKASKHYEPRLLLNGLTSVDEMTLAYLTSNKAIEIPDALKPD